MTTETLTVFTSLSYDGTKSVFLTLHVGCFLIYDFVSYGHPVIGMKIAVFFEALNFCFAYKRYTVYYILYTNNGLHKISTICLKCNK